jgi:predicted HTH transcriptional regulator
LLAHLNLLDDGALTNAAVLLFAKEPQRFLLTSELKCAHFHGTEVAKPIPSYHVYKGTVFDLVDDAVDFVLSKIALSVGTRAAGPQAPVRYELPKEVVAEAIVNAVAHRDYTSNGSVQVMLFADRLEVWNPGALPPSLTLEKLREPHASVPGNPLLAEPMYLSGYIERMGTGTRDMIRRCVEVGLPEPEFSLSDGFQVVIHRAAQAAGQVEGQVTGQVAAVSEEVARLLFVCEGEMTRQALQERLGLRGRANFLRLYLEPALDAGLLEMTRPDTPQSRLQKYRLTEKGRETLAALYARRRPS